MGYLSNNSFLIVVLLAFCTGSINAQYTEKAGGNTFYYDDDDIKKDELNFHNVFYSGFSNSLVSIDNDISLPVLPTIYFEYKYLFMPKNDVINFSGNIHPHLAIFTWLLARFPASINVNFLNEASTEQKSGIGLNLGVGYEYLASTFDFTENSPFVRVGLRIDNVRIQYQYKTASNLVVNHSISVGVQLNL